MRRSRDELSRDVAKMIKLRNQNKTYRQIAEIMGYRSAGTVSDLLKKRGHFSVVLNDLEISDILNTMATKAENSLRRGLIKKLNKARR